jgi:RNA polymerase sigma factor (sigma-70 family)
MRHVTTPITPFVPSGPDAARASSSEVARAVAGDAAAMASLLRAVRPAIVGTARRILGAYDADVDDAVQQTLIGFIHALPAYRGDAEPVAYAKAIAVRSALAIRRRLQSASARIAGEHDASALPTGDPSPNDDALAGARRALLRQLLGEIPAEQAEALAMRAVLGWSLEEIAEQSGAPVNTVRSRLRLAKEALRRKIEAAPEVYGALSLGS